MVLDLIHVYQYHRPLKSSPKNSTYDPSFEIYIYAFFSNSMTCIILSQIYFIYSSFSLFVEFFKILAKRLYLWLQFLSGLVCFHPYINSDVPYIIGD